MTCSQPITTKEFSQSQSRAQKQSHLVIQDKQDFPARQVFYHFHFLLMVTGPRLGVCQLNHNNNCYYLVEEEEPEFQLALQTSSSQILLILCKTSCLIIKREVLHRISKICLKGKLEFSWNSGFSASSYKKEKTNLRKSLILIEGLLQEALAHETCVHIAA